MLKGKNLIRSVLHGVMKSLNFRFSAIGGLEIAHMAEQAHSQTKTFKKQYSVRCSMIWKEEID